MEYAKEYVTPTQSSQPYGTGIWNLEQQGDYLPTYSTGDYILVDINFSFISKSLKLTNEITISVPNQSVHQTFHTKPTQEMNQYLSDFHQFQTDFNRNYHRLPLNYGTTTPQEMDRFLKQTVLNGDNIILVKGSEKKRYLDKLMHSSWPALVLDLETINCPKLETLFNKYVGVVAQTSCVFHRADENLCTAFKTKLLMRWIKDNKDLVNNAIECTKCLYW